MDNSELAMKMLAWEQAKKSLDTLEKEIEEAVLALGKTQTVGNVRATFSNGRKTYDYETAAVEHPMYHHATRELFTKVVETVDWKAVCEHMGVNEVPVLKQTEPSVSVKLLK